MNEVVDLETSLVEGQYQMQKELTESLEINYHCFKSRAVERDTATAKSEMLSASYCNNE